MSVSTLEHSTRKDWMGLMAKARPERLNALFEGLQESTEFIWLRRPESGGVMVRGRMGGVGAPFNLGEMTVTRCALKLAGGEVGHGYVQGRNKQHAQQAALIDALMQTDRAQEVRTTVLTPLSSERVEGKNNRAAKAAATKVDFFAMVRGED